MSVAAVLAALLLGGVYLAGDTTVAAWHLQGWVVAGLVGLAQLGAGFAVCRGDWLRALGWGVGVHVGGVALLWLTGLLAPWAHALLLLGMAAGWVRAERVDFPRVSRLALLVGALLLLPALLEALAPPTDTDEIYWQLAAPRYLLDHGELPGGFLHPDQSRPMPVQLVFTTLLALGGEAAPKLWQLGLAVALVLGVRQRAARQRDGDGDAPALALLGSYSFIQVAGLAYAELAIALWALLAAVATLERRWLELGVFAGLAVSAKYTAAPLLVGLFLVAAWDGRRELPRVAAAGGLVVLLVAPWWLRNVVGELHPLFPFAGWPDAKDFVFVYPEKYGAGHGPVDYLLLPWRVLFEADPGSFRFLGRISLAWLALGVGAWRPATRRLALPLALALVAWALSAQLLRYLLPLAGVAALAGGSARWRTPALLLFAVSLPANLAPAWTRAVDRVAVALGHQERDAFLGQELLPWPAMRYLRDHVPADEPVALLNAWTGYHLDRPYVLGSVEDHVPTRHWVWAHGASSLAVLHDAGVRWLLVGEIKYLRKHYLFLPDPVFEDQLRQPQATLESLLLRDARRVFAENRFSVWQLDAPVGSP